MAFDSEKRNNGYPSKNGYRSNRTGNGQNRVNGGTAKGDRPYRPADRRPNMQNVRRENVGESARYIALNAFEDVIRNESYASMALDKRFATVNLTQADKRLASSITYSTLENLLRIDWVMDQFVQERDKLPAQIIDILRISICQLFFFDRLPENAVVDEAVKITRFMKLEAMTGLVNAVLRGIIRKKDEIVYPEESDTVRHISVMHSMPEWLVNELIDGYGQETALDICRYRKDKHYIT
ncbi:MAG: hypothetical protein CW338_06000, partial [Clostridiales bacterium]|nr:hypothetical protein [Clostridiales bacterium]